MKSYSQIPKTYEKELFSKGSTDQVLQDNPKLVTRLAWQFYRYSFIDSHKAMLEQLEEVRNEISTYPWLTGEHSKQELVPLFAMFNSYMNKADFYTQTSHNITNKL
ncbi:hypothetical protein Ngar_c19410 [Candidatus Nitrososphaera gargensis Ga9.2]|uniref:Uncharacterized protein n=1 Tax=Nitrososphaera gargensis (strain Ga9.2) TaxID=1237085 RepID=K0IIJ2_NITGG|nr:hypothetical protein Ngar_c19410 [Candidatus Nitrososphaera gargensis Ga9.2]